MFIQGIKKRGHTYYAVYHGKRLVNKVIRETKLYLGRLDKMDELKRIDLENKLNTLGDSAIIQKFRSILVSEGYLYPSPLSHFSIEHVRDYGVELALHKVCEEIDFINVVNRHSSKGGGPELGKIVEALAIARNCDPCSYYHIPDWYSRSSLPFFLKLPLNDLTYDVTLRALDYLQPENTIPMQCELYENIRKAYGYTCERLDIDLTSTYFEGNECILAEFGHTRDYRSDRPQIVVAFVVDQKGVFVTHRVWPGNKSDAKSLKPVDRCLKNEFGLDATIVVDRGIATEKNIKYMDRKKEHYLVAIRAKIKSTKLLDDIKTPRDEWNDIGDGQFAASITKGRRKYVVVWNASVAETNRKDRESRIRKAENDLKDIQISVEKGKTVSRKNRDEKIGHILKKYRVKKYILTKGHKKGFGFSIEKKKAVIDVEKYDGYTVFVTTELRLTEKDVVESYKTRDQIEKAIRTLKNVLALHPQNVRTKEHVLGNIFVCATAFQLRSILNMKLKNNNEQMSVEEAMRTLEQLKAVHISVGKDGEVQVYRKLAGCDDKARTIIEIFDMGDDELLRDANIERNV